MRYLSLFSGVGGFELGIQQAYVDSTTRDENRRIKEDKEGDKGQGLLSSEGQDTNSEKRLSSQYNRDITNEGQPTCVGFSEIDKYATAIYQKHFPEHKAYGDVTKINAEELPDFDLLVGGFPCQAFSIAGKRRGFDDTRGTLFFDIARILKEKRPRNFVLENVKGLLSHDRGRTFKTIISTLTELGYCVEWQVLNAKNFGVPQNRERVFIVGHLGGIPERKVFPIGNFNPKDIEQINGGASQGYRVYGENGLAPTQASQAGGLGAKTGLVAPTIRATEYKHGDNQTTVKEGRRIRRLTPLECERLMGFTDGWTDGLSDTQRYKTLGNGVVSNVVAEIIKKLATPQAHYVGE